ncbi:MAG: hypothetical protein L0Z50_04860 [Verrucomicrobiales bacterium]|nr:hypothetical protein [Verrucomicrobiales bacterium]
MKQTLFPLILITANSLLAAPANDLFGPAEVLSGSNLTVNANNRSADTQLGEPKGFATLGWLGPLVVRSLWYSWTAPTPGTLTLDTAGSSFDTALAVFVGPSLEQLRAAAANNNTSTSLTARVSFRTTPGVNYFISVGTPTSHAHLSGDLTLRLNFEPDNGVFSVVGADDLNVPSLLDGAEVMGLANTTYAITRQEGEPNDGQAAGTVWWEWIAPFDGIVFMDTRGSTFGTLLTVYEGDRVDRLEEVTRSAVSTTSIEASVKFRARQNESYKIRVSGHSLSLVPPGGFGNVVLNLAQEGPADEGLHIFSAVQMEIHTRLGQKYQIQRSENLTQWEDIDPPFAGDGELKSWCFRVDGAGRNFYRAFRLQE